MDRLIDVAAVLLLAGAFAGATAFVALRAPGRFGSDAPLRGSPSESTYAARVASAVPRLEAHVAAGSMRDRALVCDENARIADIAAIERDLGEGDDPSIATPLASGLVAVRACVACTPEPSGCADAARAFRALETRLRMPRSAGDI
jgi:hypothetical protein